MSSFKRQTGQFKKKTFTRIYKFVRFKTPRTILAAGLTLDFYLLFSYMLLILKSTLLYFRLFRCVSVELDVDEHPPVRALN